MKESTNPKVCARPAIDTIDPCCAVAHLLKSQCFDTEQFDLDVRTRSGPRICVNE